MVLTDHYESMRAYAKNGKNSEKGLPMGLDIFLKKGMKTWVDAWCSTSMLKVDIKENINQASAIIPEVLIPDIVGLIAGLLLGAKEENENYA